MGEADTYVPGGWNITCDVSGRKVKAYKARHRWDGALVHPDHWEPRHPQEFVRGVKDDQSVPFNRSGPLVSVAVLGIVSPVPQPGAPIAPSALVVISTIIGQVDLTWVDNSADEAGFVIERKLTNISADPALNGHFPLVGSVGPSIIVFTQTGLQSGQSFDFQVSSKGNTGALSIPSNSFTIVIL